MREPPPPLLVTADSHCSGLCGETGVLFSIASCGGLQGLSVVQPAVLKVTMHFSIPETEVRAGENGSTYVVSMIFFLCRARVHLTWVKHWLELAMSYTVLFFMCTV